MVLAHQMRDSAAQSGDFLAGGFYRPVQTLAFDGGVGCNRVSDLPEYSVLTDQIGLSEAGSRRKWTATEPTRRSYFFRGCKRLRVSRSAEATRPACAPETSGAN